MLKRDLSILAASSNASYTGDVTNACYGPVCDHSSNANFPGYLGVEPIAKLSVPAKSPFLAILPLRRQVLLSRVCPWRRSSGRVATLTNWPKIIDFSGAGSFAIGSVYFSFICSAYCF
jgi:hypothetical protein